MKSPAWKTVDCPVCGAKQYTRCTGWNSGRWATHDLRRDAARGRVLYLWCPAFEINEPGSCVEVPAQWVAHRAADAAREGHTSLVAMQAHFHRAGRACVLGLELVGPPEGPPRG